MTCEFVSTLYGQPFLVLDWVQGPKGASPDLGVLLRQGKFGPRGAIQIGLDICGGLIHAAERVPQLVHRDLKPSNILIGADLVARITDFGMAQSALDSAAGAMDLGVGGTPRYMAPEQWTVGPLDARTDVYAVGCILFELLAGHSVYSGPELEDFRRQHLTGSIPALDGFSMGEAARILPLLTRCLAKDREQRPTPAELMAALSDVYEQAFGAAPPTQHPPSAPSAREWSNRGTSYQTLGKPEEAYAAFTKALEMEPHYAHARAARGAVLLSLDRDDEALRDLNQAVEDDPNLAEAYVNRAGVFVNLKRSPEALRDYQTAIEKDPSLQQAYLFRGQLLESLGQFEKALADYESVTRIDPLQREAWSRQAWTCMQLGRDEEAIRRYTEAIRLARTAKDYVQRALVYNRSGRMAETIDDASAAIQMDPENMRAYMLRGHARKNLGYASNDLDLLQGALEDYGRAIQLDPATARDAYMGRARMLSRAYREEPAIRDFTRAIELDPALPDAYLERGQAYIDIERYAEATEDFEHVLSIDPKNAGAWKSMGDARQGAGEHQHAITDYTKAMKLSPNWADAYLDRGISRRALGRKKAALNDLNRAIEINPDFAEAYRVRSELNAVLGNKETAAADMVRGMDMHVVDIPLSSGTEPSGEMDDDTIAENDASGIAPSQELRVRAEALSAAKRYAEGLAVCEEWIAADTDDADAWHLRGYCKVRLGDTQAGVEDYTRAIALRPEYALAYNNRGVARRTLQQAAAAVADFDNAIRLAPNYAMAYINRGGAYFASGDIERALADMTKGIELEPEELAGYPDRAAVYSKLGRIDDALADLHHALRIDPKYGPAFVNLGILEVNRGEIEEGLRSLERAASLGVPEARGLIEHVQSIVQDGHRERAKGL